MYGTPIIFVPYEVISKKSFSSAGLTFFASICRFWKPFISLCAMGNPEQRGITVTSHFCSYLHSDINATKLSSRSETLLSTSRFRRRGSKSRALPFLSCFSWILIQKILINVHVYYLCSFQTEQETCS
jgi:hypothetical protein